MAVQGARNSLELDAQRASTLIVLQRFGLITLVLCHMCHHLQWQKL